MPPTASPLLATLRQPNYGRYAVGNGVSLVGNWTQRVAVGWLTWELTHSGTWLGVMALADLAPTVLLGPLGGALADRVSPVRITLVCQTLAMLLTAALCVLTALDHINAPGLAALVLAQGMVMGFVQPARFALVYALVPRDHLATAVAINSIAFNCARFVGPAIAGATLVWSGPALAFGLNAASFVAFIAALASLKLDTPETERPASKVKQSLLREVREGARYAVSHPFIGPLLAFSVVISITVRAYVELLPGFADLVLGGGAADLAILSSSAGLGAVIAGVWLAGRGAAIASARFVVRCGAGSALGVCGLAASTNLIAASVCVTFAGAAMVMTGITAQTLMQLNVAPELRGRVMSLYGLVFRSGPAIGALLMGVASEWFGLQWPIAVSAALALVVCVLFRHRAVRMDVARLQSSG